MSEETNITKTSREITVRDIPIGILIGVAALYSLYLLAWLVGFPGIFSFIAIFIVVHVAEFLLFVSYRVITGIKLLIEIETEEFVNAPSDNSEHPVGSSGDDASPK